MQLILASQSPYKQSQLSLFNIPFSVVNPDVEEINDQSVSIPELSKQLALQKAKAVFTNNPQAIIIGSDQTAAIKDSNNLLTKPGKHTNAINQLLMCSGQLVCFYSGISLLTVTAEITWTVETQVQFRKLTRSEVERYVESDQPLDCAGGFKVEALGITLFQSIQSEDPSALVGLPLISLASNLREFGFALP